MDPGRVVKWRKKEISKFKIQDTAELFWPLGVFLTRKKTVKNTENKDKKRPIIACRQNRLELTNDYLYYNNIIILDE